MTDVQAAGAAGGPPNAIQVAVRVRPLNDKERDEGARSCVVFDETTKQVVLSAVDKDTLLQLRGRTAVGYAFDRRYGPEHTSDTIFDDCVSTLVEHLFKGYNGTVLAYGQTGSGKTHTMSGGCGIHGLYEQGITRRVAMHLFAIADAIKQQAKPGESVKLLAYGLELYNEELRDLASMPASKEAGAKSGFGSSAERSGAPGGSAGSSEIKIAERVMKDGRVVTEVTGVSEVPVNTAEELIAFFNNCCDHRAVAATNMNATSSRSHAIYGLKLSRAVVDVSDGKVRTTQLDSKFTLVDLAGSERVKRSGVTGQGFKEATFINNGLLTLGNVIVALSEKEGTDDKRHIPYRDSKLTRLLQDSLGGNSLTVLVSCISPSETNFEETNNTLKYANRACRIKNTPLPAAFLALEEDLLPMLPSANGGQVSMMQIQQLLAEHGKMRELAEKREAERREKEAQRRAELLNAREADAKKPGIHRLRAQQYDELRKAAMKQGTNLGMGQVITDPTLTGFRNFEPPEEAAAAGPTSRATSAARSSSRSPDPGARPRRHTCDGPGGEPSNAAATGAAGAAAAAGSKSPVKRGASFNARAGSPAAGAAAPAGAGAGKPPAARTTSFNARAAAAEAAKTSFSVSAALDSSSSGAAAKPAKPPTGAAGRATMPAVPETSSGGAADEAAQPDAYSHEPAAAAEVGDITVKSQQLTMKEQVLAAGVEQHLIKAYVSDKEEREAVCDEESEVLLTNEYTEEVEVLSDDTDELAEAAAAVESQDRAAGDSTMGPTEYLTLRATGTTLLARFKVNHTDTLAVFKASSDEDFLDVAALLPAGTALPAADRMTYLLARLESRAFTSEELDAALESVASGAASMGAAVGPAVGCLMTTLGTSLISDCIFEFDDPDELSAFGQQQRLELWGLQIPHNPARPALVPSEEAAAAAAAAAAEAGDPAAAAEAVPQRPVEAWTSADRLNVSVGLLYALCSAAKEAGAMAGFCVPRPQLLRRWLQAGVRMKQVGNSANLIYPTSAHDYAYYKGSTVAYFLVDEVQEALAKVLSIVNK